MPSLPWTPELHTVLRMISRELVYLHSPNGLYVTDRGVPAPPYASQAVLDVGRAGWWYEAGPRDERDIPLRLTPVGVSVLAEWDAQHPAEEVADARDGR